MMSNESQPVDPTAAALQRVILKNVDAARAAIGPSPELSTIERRTRDFFGALGGVQSQLQEVRDNRDLSDEGKTKRRAAILASLDELRRQATADIVSAVVDFQKRHLGEIRPQPPESDPMLLEAKLQTARMDARMMFDGVEASALPLAMHQAIASGADPVLSHLLLSTPWAQTYLASRQAPPAAMNDWERRKAAALPLVLSERQRAGYEALKALEKTEQTLVGAHKFFVVDRGL